MLKVLYFYIFVWWFKKIENKNTLIVRAALSSALVLLFIISGIVIFTDPLMAEDGYAFMGIFALVPAILLSLRAFYDIKKILLINNSSKEITPRIDNINTNEANEQNVSLASNSSKEITSQVDNLNTNKINEQIAPLVERVFMFLEDGEWDKANEYCERILDINPKNQNAYLGKLMVDYHIKQKTELANCKKDFEQNNNYKRIVQYGEPDFVLEIQQYLSQLKEKQRNANLYKQATLDYTKQKTKRILQMAIIPVVLIASLICVLCYTLPKENKDTPIYIQQFDTIEYKSMTLKIPHSDDYTIKVFNGKIYISGKFNITINEFLSYIKAPSGKSFYATNGFASANGSKSFLWKNFITLTTYYYPDDKGNSETLDLVFFGYTDFHAIYVNKNGNVPMSWKGGGALKPSNGVRPNYLNDVQFDIGETILVGQYYDSNTKANSTTVEIIIVKE